MKTIKIFVLSLVTLSACHRSSQSETQATVNQSGYDITTLQAWISNKTTAVSGSNNVLGPNFRLYPDNCQEISSTDGTWDGVPYRSITGDCSSTLESLARLSQNAPVSPLINEATHSFSVISDGRVYPGTGLCEIIEFRTVIRDVALAAASFQGIGFKYQGEKSFIEKSRLHAVGSVTLKDGQSATVHRFISQGMCFGLGGNGGSIADRQYRFRPFAQFEGDDSNTYRVWDEVQNDYVLGRDSSDTSFVQTFDRQNEILQQ